MNHFYQRQGLRTMVPLGTFAEMPKDISEICKVVQGLLIHPGHLNEYGIEFSEDRIKDKYIGHIEVSILRLQEIQQKSLVQHREPAFRIVHTCRQFAMFLCSILREQGVPARCRCGFATYFAPGWFEDHWICEYWSDADRKWIRVDSQIDFVQKKELKLNPAIDLKNLSKDAFFPAGALWLLYRQGIMDGDCCGYSLEEGECGAWYIRCNLIRDFFAIRQAEYTCNEIQAFMGRDASPPDDALLLLDKIAAFTLECTKTSGFSAEQYELMRTYANELRRYGGVLPGDWQ